MLSYYWVNAWRELGLNAGNPSLNATTPAEIAARLAVEHRELDAERQVARGWFARENDRRNELVALERRKSQMLAGTRRESAELASAALELGERARKISSLLDALYGRSDLGLGGLPIRDFRGLLDWPVAGRVIAEFGPRVDPRYGTRVPHNGLDLETVPGSEVLAVYPGKVLFAAPFEGLGQMVVVQHAGRVFTLYAGLSELRVRKPVKQRIRATAALLLVDRARRQLGLLRDSRRQEPREPARLAAIGPPLREIEAPPPLP